MLEEYAGKTVDEMLEITERLLSATVSCAVHKADSGKQYIACEGVTRWLPTGEKLHLQRCRQLSNGGNSYLCVSFFS